MITDDISFASAVSGSQWPWLSATISSSEQFQNATYSGLQSPAAIAARWDGMIFSTKNLVPASSMPTRGTPADS